MQPTPTTFTAAPSESIEYTFGVQRDPADPYMPPLPQRDVYMAPMALYEMKEFSGALLHEESSSQVPYIPNARKVVDEIIKLKQDDEQRLPGFDEDSLQIVEQPSASFDEQSLKIEEHPLPGFDEASLGIVDHPPPPPPPPKRTPVFDESSLQITTS